MNVNYNYDTSTTLCYRLWVMGDIKAWIRTQWGPRTPYGSPRELALKISDGHNQNIVADIERKGVLTFKTAKGLSKATGVNVLTILLMAGLIEENDLERVLTPNQEKATEVIAGLPEDFASAWLESGERLRQLARGSDT